MRITVHRSWARGSAAGRPKGPRAAGRHGGFTLFEVLVATSILLLAMSLTMGAYLAAVKRAVHAQRALSGIQELRYATDLIAEAARSSPQAPVVQAGGQQLVLAPKDLGYATVLETTWIDVLHSVKGSRSNQRMLKLSNVTPASVTFSIFDSSARPSGAITADDVATYFTDSASLPTTDLNDLFATGDTLTIPATSYGPSISRVINSISNNAGNKTLTMTSDLGFDVPNGTRIAATAGRRLLLSVENSGDLRYYPDRRDLTRFIILARDIDPAPLSDPSNTSSARTVPFVLTGRFITLNLQKLPRGSIAGRTVLGVQTAVYTRTDPLIP